MSDYVKRMEEEDKQLRAKLYAGNGFLQGPRGQALATEKRMLLTKQLKHMTKYHETLEERIKLELEEAVKN